MTTNASQIQRTQATLASIETDWLIVPITEDPSFPANIKVLDETLNGTLTALRERGDIKGKAGELTLLPIVLNLTAQRLLLVGLGDPKKITLTSWEQAVLAATRRAATNASVSVAIAVPDELLATASASNLLSTTVSSAIVSSSGQGLYKATPERFPFKQITLVTSVGSDADLERGCILGNAINLTRELVNRHPEDLIPETFAARAQAEAVAAGIECEVFSLQRLQVEKMGALLAVARGSVHEPRVVVFRYNGAGEEAPWLALCGKGVTYDSGGLSIKPSDSMITMKGDMAGAATVLGTLTALARLKTKVNVLGVIGLVENMIGPHSYKLGEVLTARNGTTIEIHNTDAEGRLVLADILAYAAEQKPAQIIDLATLTGACVVALGMDIAGAFTNSQDWCNHVLAAAKETGEELWQLPMNDSFNEQLKSDFADIKNVGSRWGGAITAAKFLEKFVDNTPWVHMDIAGPSFVETNKPFRDIGGTGSSVRTLVSVAEKLV